MSTVDDRRAAYHRDHRKASPSDDQPRDSVYSFDYLAGDPRPTRTGTLPDNRRSRTMGQAPPPPCLRDRDVLVLAVADN